VALENCCRPRVDLTTILGRREKIWGSAVHTDNLVQAGLKVHSQYYRKMADVNQLPVWRVADGRHPNHRYCLPMKACKPICIEQWYLSYLVGCSATALEWAKESGILLCSYLKVAPEGGGIFAV